MTRENPKAGMYISVYLPARLYDELRERAAASGTSIPAQIKNTLMRTILGEEQSSVTESKPKPAAKQPPPSFDELVKKYRDRVRDLEAKAYTENAIAAVLHIPYRVVQEILSTPAPPKKGGPK